jgi:hypothetical protein
MFVGKFPPLVYGMLAKIHRPIIDIERIDDDFISLTDT